MKNNSSLYLNISLVLLLALLATSCDYFKKDAVIDTSISKAESNLKNHPDSTLKIANKLLYLSSKNAFDDEKRLAIYQLKYRAFLKFDKLDSFYITGQKIREVASKIPDSLAIAETLLDLLEDTDYQYVKEAKVYIPGAISTFGNANKEYEKGIICELYGNIMNEEGDFKKSQIYYLKALKIFESKDSTYAMSRVNNELGVNFACLKVMDKSNYYYSKALQIAEIRKDSFQRSCVLQNFGINFKKSNPTKAIEIYNQALDLMPKKGKEMERVRLNYNIANIYFEQNKFDEAEVIYKRVMEVSIQNENQDGIVMSNFALGNLFSKKKQYAISESYFLATLKILEKTNQKNLILMTLPTLIEVYENSGDYKKAYYYSNKLNKLKDDLLTIEKTKSILELEKKYETEKKDLEILNLEKLSSLRYKIIFTLLISLLIVLYLLRQRNRLYYKNKNAYAVLIKKYKDENESRNNKIITVTTFGNKAKNTDNFDDKDEFYSRLLFFYESEKPYLDSNLKVEFIAKKMNTNQRELAFLVKKYGFSSFNNFNNKFRIEEVKKCFDDDQFKQIKTQAIALQCGFGSKQPFYNAFEEFTGLNPGFYRDEMSKS